MKDFKIKLIDDNYIKVVTPLNCTTSRTKITWSEMKESFLMNNRRENIGFLKDFSLNVVDGKFITMLEFIVYKELLSSSYNRITLIEDGNKLIFEIN